MPNINTLFAIPPSNNYLELLELGDNELPIARDALDASVEGQIEIINNRLQMLKANLPALDADSIKELLTSLIKSEGYFTTKFALKELDELSGVVAILADEYKTKEQKEIAVQIYQRVQIGQQYCTYSCFIIAVLLAISAAACSPNDQFSAVMPLCIGAAVAVCCSLGCYVDLQKGDATGIRKLAGRAFEEFLKAEVENPEGNLPVATVATLPQI